MSRVGSLTLEGWWLAVKASPDATSLVCTSCLKHLAGLRNYAKDDRVTRSWKGATAPQKGSVSRTNLGLREAPFWNVLVLYGLCLNSFRPPPSVRQTNEEEKVPQTIQASPYTPRQTWGKMPLWKQHISKRGFPKNETCVSLSSLWDWNWFLRRTVNPLKPLLVTLGRCTLDFPHPRNMSVPQGKTSSEARGPNIYRNSFQKVLLREPFFIHLLSLIETLKAE